MRQEWWIVCWRPCSRGLPSATEGKGHRSQKVSIMLLSCYFLGNCNKEQHSPFSQFFQSCVPNGVPWAAALQEFCDDRCWREAFPLAGVTGMLTNQRAEPGKAWLVRRASSKGPYVPYPSAVHSSIVKWEVKVVTLLLQVYQGIEALLCFRKYLTLEKCLILLYFLRWTELYIKFLLCICVFNRYSAESQSSISEAYSESL